MRIAHGENFFILNAKTFIKYYVISPLFRTRKNFTLKLNWEHNKLHLFYNKIDGLLFKTLFINRVMFSQMLLLQQFPLIKNK